MHPWDGVIPDEDMQAFAGFKPVDRPIDTGKRPAIIVVDMVRAMVDDKFFVGYSKTGKPAVAATKHLLDSARPSGVPIFFTKMHPQEYWERTAPMIGDGGRWKHRTTLDMLSGDVVVEELGPKPEDTIIYKTNKPSGFFGTDLVALLIQKDVDTLIITGSTTSGCHRATVVDGFSFNYRILIPHECCFDRSQISHKVNLFDMHMKYADVISLAQTIDYLATVTHATPTALAG